MKLIAVFFAALFLAALTMSIPTSHVSTKAFASKMDGKGSPISDKGRPMLQKEHSSSRARALLQSRQPLPDLMIHAAGS